MRVVSVLLVCTQLLITGVLCSSVSSTNDAYPTGYGDESGACMSGRDVLKPLRRDVYYEGGEIIDITHKLTPNTPGGTIEGCGDYLSLVKSMKNGSDSNASEMKLNVHVGTHVDTPGHIYDHYFDAGFDVDSLDLRVLNGPALVVDIPRDKNITAEVVKALNIPRGIRRVLFRTLNTDRRLMYKRQIDLSFVGFTEDGAQWVVDNTDIKLVGIDYISIAAFDSLLPAHQVFLKNADIIIVEGLKLDDVQPGIYTVHCLPPRMVGAEGSPIRCILIN